MEAASAVEQRDKVTDYDMAERTMEHHKLVLPEHLNPYGFLYGGYLLQWIDEVGYTTAIVDFPGQEFVTVAMDDVVFHHKVLSGEVLRFTVDQVRKGNTSLHYHVKVFALLRSGDPDRVVFETGISFVAIDADGNKARVV